MYNEIKQCRACGSLDLSEVFSLGAQPLANDFCAPGAERSGFAPLTVLLCVRCGLAQLSVVVKPEDLYRNYAYVTSDSHMMGRHFERLWADCSVSSDNRTVLEIGSNDGTFLKFCARNGAESVMGIEPATNLADIARSRGIHTLNDFFGSFSASAVAQTIPKVGMIFARHVFCHIADWLDFTRNLQLVADGQTQIFIEVPYVKDLLEKRQFDTIYHEHLSYLSIRAMKALLDNGPFCLRKIMHYDIHGGAIVLVLQRNGPGVHIDPSVAKYLEAEDISRQTWKEFSASASFQISMLGGYVEKLVRSGAKVVGYGASAKSTVWINACGFTRKDLHFVTDTTLQKQHRLIPGTDIPVLEPEALLREKPDYAILFAWNYAAEVLEKETILRQLGLKFIVPGPELRVIGIDPLPTAA